MRGALLKDSFQGGHAFEVAFDLGPLLTLPVPISFGPEAHWLLKQGNSQPWDRRVTLHLAPAVRRRVVAADHERPLQTFRP